MQEAANAQSQFLHHLADAVLPAVVGLRAGTRVSMLEFPAGGAKLFSIESRPEGTLSCRARLLSFSDVRNVAGG